MKNCICNNSQPIIEDSTFGKYIGMTGQHRVRCENCRIKTSFYPFSEQAELAWDSKAWVNRRRGLFPLRRPIIPHYYTEVAEVAEVIQYSLWERLVRWFIRAL